MPLQKRVRTPSTIKWLLTEHAAVSGALLKAEQKLALVTQKLTKVALAYHRLVAEQGATSLCLVQKSGALDALARTLILVSPEVNPHAGGSVFPRGNRFGKQGKLKEFLVKTLQSAAPDAVSTTELVDLAIEQFEITIYMPEVRRSVRRNITVSLRRLLRSGELEALFAEPPEDSGIWRWKQPDTLADLSARAAAIAKAAADEGLKASAGSPAPADPNTPGCKVAPQ